MTSSLAVLPSDWFTAAEPDPMLRAVWPEFPSTDGLPPKLARRLRLFAVACARQVWNLLPTDARSAVLISERFADDRATETDLRAAAVLLSAGPITMTQHAQNAAGYASIPMWARNNLGRGIEPIGTARNAARALATRAAGPAPLRVGDDWHCAWSSAFQAARVEQAEFVRDIFPPPDELVNLDPGWLMAPVRDLAWTMNEAGNYAALPILADALQDAGCEHPAILSRCRHPGPHVRGNWVVDLILVSQ